MEYTRSKKRKDNTTGIKVKYLGPTNNLGTRVKLTQLNNNKSKVFNYDYNIGSVLEQACIFLDNCNFVKSYNVIIDNTQQNYYLININFEGDYISDLFI